MLSRLKKSWRRNLVRKSRSLNARARRGGLRFEGLEDRSLMAFNVSLTGNDVTFQGDSNNDSLVLTLGSGGVLTHNIPLATSGLASATDLDPTTAGVQARAVSVITGLTIDGGDGTDAVTFSGSSTNFGFTQITSGRSASITSETLTLTSTAINVSGGTFTASGNSLVKTGSLTWTTNSGTLSLNYPTTGIALGSGNVSSGSISLTGGSVTGTGEWTSLTGDISISATGNLDLPARVSAAATGSSVGNVTVSATGDVSYGAVLTDGGSVTISGNNIVGRPTTGAAGILTNRSLPLSGPVQLNPAATGTVTLSSPIDASSFSVGTNAGISSTSPFLIRGSSLSLSSDGAIALGGRVDAPDATSVSLSAGGGVSTSLLVANNANVTVSGSSVTLGTTQVDSNDLTITATGAVTIGSVRVGGTLTSSGTTFTQTTGSKFSVPMTELKLDHSGTSTFNGEVTTNKITSTGAGQIVFGSTSVWNVNLATATPALSAVGNVEFASGALVNLDPRAINVENVSIYRIVETTGSVIDNGMNLTAILPIDNEDEYTIFIPEVETLAGGGQGLKIFGYVRENLVVNCGGSCTLVLGTDSTHFGPTLMVLNSSRVNIIPTNTPVGLVDYLEINGNANSTDTLTVDYSNGDPLSYQGVKFPAVYDGGVGTGTDTLTFVDANGATNGSYEFDTFSSTSIDANSGIIAAGAKEGASAVSPGEIGYLNLKAVTTALPIATETVTFTSGNDAVTLTQLSATNIRFNGSTITTLSTPKPSVQMNIYGGDGTDSLTYSITTTDYQTNGASVTIDSENITQNNTVVTLGGSLNYSGSGTYSGIGNSTNFNTLGGTGAGTVTINQGTINMLGGTAKGDVSLTAATTLSVFDFSTAEGNATVTAGGNISLNAVSAPSGTIAVSSAGGSITGAGSKSLATDGGTITISANSGTLSLGPVTAGSGATRGAVNISSDGNASTGNVTAATLSLSSASGSISTGVINLNGGTLELTGTQAITVAGAAVSGPSSNGTIAISAVGTLTINGAMSTDGGGITLNADRISLASTSTSIAAGLSPNLGPVSITTTTTTQAGTLGAVTGSSIDIQSAFDLSTGVLTAGAGNIGFISAGSLSVTGVSATGAIGPGTVNLAATGAVTATGAITTNAGAVTISGSQATLVAVNAGNSVLGFGPVSITTTAGAIRTAAVGGSSITLDSATDVTATAGLAASAGAVSITALGTVNLTTVSATGTTGEGSVTINASGTVTATSTINTASTGTVGAISITGGQLALAGVSTGTASGTGNTLSVTSTTGSTAFTGAVLGGTVTINSATTLSTSGAVTALVGSIGLTSAGNMTLGGDVAIAAATGSGSATISANSGTGILEARGSILSNGGGVTLSGGSFLNLNSKSVRAATASATTGATGTLTMNFDTTISLNGTTIAGSMNLTAGTTFTTVGAGDTLVAYMGGIVINAPGGISLFDSVTMNTRLLSQASSTFSAGTAAIRLRQTVATTNAVRTFGGNLTLNGGTLTTNGPVNLFEGVSRMGSLTMNHSGLITINQSLNARSYTVTGGGNMTFAGTAAAKMTMQVNVNNPQVVFTQTGGGNLTVPASNGGFVINGIATGSIVSNTTTDYPILTTTGTFTYAGATPTKTGLTAKVTTISVQTANKRVIVRVAP
jgi:hypothetical protein